MIYEIRGAKGGVGTSTLAATLALSIPDSLLVDLGTDQAAVLGIAEPAGPGVTEWLMQRSHDATLGNLHELAVPVTDTLKLLHRGAWHPSTVNYLPLIPALDGQENIVIDNAERVNIDSFHLPMKKILATKSCYLALRKAASMDWQPDHIIVLMEPGRALSDRDIERAIGCPSSTVIHYDPSVTRAIDAGLLAARLPASVKFAADTMQRKLNGMASQEG